MPKESPERFIRFEQVVRPEDGKSTDGAIVPSRDNPDNFSGLEKVKNIRCISLRCL